MKKVVKKNKLFVQSVGQWILSNQAKADNVRLTGIRILKRTKTERKNLNALKKAYTAY